MESPKILILEDEFIVAEDMAMQLSKVGFQVCGIFDNGKDTIDSFRSNKPDIVLIDINIQGDLDGVETAERLINFSNTPLIFITAYSGSVYFERAKKVKPHAYLVKPFNYRNLITSIELALNNFQDGNFRDEKSVPESSSGQEHTGNYLVNDYIFLKRMNHFDKVSIRDILYLEADGSYCKIITREGEYTLSKNLQHVINNIKFKSIVRSHRSYAVNINYVTGYTKSSVILDKHEIPMSNFYRGLFLEKLKMI